MNLIDCMLTRWSPGIGDPTVIGWVTVMAYLVAILLCLRAVSVGRRTFVVLLAVLFALMLNKQLDLHVGLIAFGRCAAQAQGWFASRRAIQAGLAVAVLVICAAALAFAVWRLRRGRGIGWQGLAGLGCLAALIGLRAVDFLHLDTRLGFEVLTGPVTITLELAGIALIGWAAWRARVTELRR